MSAFVDPRTRPDPTAAKPPARTATDPRELDELHRLCREGCLYDVERWIQSKQPLQAARGVTVKGRRLTSALEIALERRDQALVFLLLCNGYDPNLEPSSPVDLALRARRWDLLDLLLEWGADPRRVSLSDLFDTYRSELWYRFRDFGIDLTDGHQMAEALAYHTSNKPLFGFAKRHRESDPKIQRELDIALVHHAGEGNEKGVQLCLWAGAHPHAPAPSFRQPEYLYREEQEGMEEEDRFEGFTAVFEACRGGHAEILRRLRPDPSRDDFDDLYQTADSTAVIDVLAELAPPKNAGPIVRWKMLWLDSPFGDSGMEYRALHALERLFEVGMRWETAEPSDVAYVRRSLLKLSNSRFVDLTRLFAARDHCSPEILKALGSTPKMRERMKAVGFVPLPDDHPRRWEQARPARSREVLAKFGIQLPKPKRWIPRTVEIGGWRRGGKEIRLDRAGLFERVWSTPVWALAREWALSGRGLAKACERLQIPLPPRGFWAKAQHGKRVRRPNLPALAPGEAEEIVIRLPDTEGEGETETACGERQPEE